MPQANLNSITRMNGLSRMLPLFRRQSHVYRMGEASPSGLEGYFPRWEVVNAIIAAKQTYQTTIDLMPGFHLLALLGSASVNNVGVGGFRVHLYDKSRNIRLQARGVQINNWGGAAKYGFFLREPYPFDLPKSQAMVDITNLEAASNTIQIVLYGVAAPFTGQDNAAL
jgi:hypothetical protein